MKVDYVINKMINDITLATMNYDVIIVNEKKKQ